MRADSSIEYIRNQLIDAYRPQRLLLFGSQARNAAVSSSDIDLCVVMEVKDKRAILSEMYIDIKSDMPFDLLLYTPDEWEHCIQDKTSFAYKINKDGVLLYG
jgi:predicted nucleotidyltransferase